MRLALILLILLAVLAYVANSMGRRRNGQLAARGRGRGRGHGRGSSNDRVAGLRGQGRGRGRGSRRGPLGGRFRSRGGRRRFPVGRRFGSAGTIEFSSWEQDINDTLSATEKARIDRTNEIIFLKSVDKDLKDADISPSVAFYDFKNKVAVIATKVNDTRVCFRLPESVLIPTFSSIADEIAARNGTTGVATVDTPSFIMKDADKLSKTQVRSLRSDRNFPFRLCRRRAIIDAVQVDDSTDTDADSVMVLSIGGKTTIYLNSTLTL